VHDSETGYDAPSGIEFKWSGDRRDGEGRLTATLTVDKLGATQGEGGLIEKVDVLQEIPYVIRKALAAVTGTKPYIYQVRCAESRIRKMRSSAYDSITTLRLCKSRSMARLSLSTGGYSTRLRSSPSR
jgi:hypothetical protein